MDRQKINLQLDNYINEVEKVLFEPVLERDVGTICIDRVKAFFVLLPKLNGEVWTEKMNDAAIAVGAVHAALEAHDSIELENATTKKQQLSVLSGDYYSGIHYRLLSLQKNFGFIRTLSETIGSINEIKTNFHKQPLNNDQETINLIRAVEAGCIVNFFNAFDFERYIPLVNVALPLTKMAQKTISFRQLTTDELIEPIKLLRSELDIQITQVENLNPILREEVLSSIMPINAKSI